MLLSSQFYHMQQNPGLLVPLTSKLLKPSTWSVRDSCCRSTGNSSSETTRLQRLPACRRSRKLSVTVVVPSSVTLREYNNMSRRTRPSTSTSTCLLVDHPTTSGNIVRANHEGGGSTRSGRTMESPQWICGGVRRVVVTEEQHCGLPWLCDNDDDDDLKALLRQMLYLQLSQGIWTVIILQYSNRHLITCSHKNLHMWQKSAKLYA